MKKEEIIEVIQDAFIFLEDESLKFATQFNIYRHKNSKYGWFRENDIEHLFNNIQDDDIFNIGLLISVSIGKPKIKRFDKWSWFTTNVRQSVHRMCGEIFDKNIDDEVLFSEDEYEIIIQVPISSKVYKNGLKMRNLIFALSSSVRNFLTFDITDDLEIQIFYSTSDKNKLLSDLDEIEKHFDIVDQFKDSGETILELKQKFDIIN